MSNTKSSCGSGANPSTSDHYPDDTDDSTAATLPSQAQEEEKLSNVQNKWEEEMSWITHSRKGDHYAYFKVCNKDLSCSEGGLKDIKI